jgi:hypothetical protein
MIDRTLLALLLGCAAFGTAIALELDAPAGDPSPAPVAAAPAPAAPKPQPRAKEPVEELVAGAEARPLFTPTRRPAEKGGSADSGEPELKDIRLTGILVEADRHLAIFAIAGGKPLVRSEGETLKEWRLDSISPTEVSLSGPDGLRTLAPKTDPNLVRPAPPVRPQPPAAPAAAGQQTSAQPAPVAGAPPRPATIPPTGRPPGVVPLAPRPPAPARPPR